MAVSTISDVCLMCGWQSRRQCEFGNEGPRKDAVCLRDNVVNTDVEDTRPARDLQNHDAERLWFRAKFEARTMGIAVGRVGRMVKSLSVVVDEVSFGDRVGVIFW